MNTFYTGALRAVSRILFCTWQYHPAHTGGAERQARLQAEELVARGHDVTVVCPRTPHLSSGYVGGVRVTRLHRVVPSHFTSPVRFVGSIIYFVNLWRYVVLHGRHFDVAHVHLANLQADIVVSAARLIGLPTHVKVANSGTHGETRRLRRVARLTQWYGLRHATSVQALSHEARKELLRIGVDERRIARIPNGVPGVEDHLDQQEARRSLGLSPDGRVVLFMGRFAQYKGLGDLLAAWPQVARRDWTLHLVGEEATDKPFGLLPQLAGLEVHPWCTQPTRYLQAADVFVLPSHSEGMSNALLEAMSVGIAIVSSDTGAASEMIAHGESGLIYETGDIQGLANRLDAVMTDEDLRRRLAAGAHKRAAQFSVDRVVDQLEKTYRQILR